MGRETVLTLFGENTIRNVPMPWKQQMISHLKSVTNLSYYNVSLSFSVLSLVTLFVDQEDGFFLHQLIESERYSHVWEKHASDLKLTHIGFNLANVGA